MDTNTVVEVAQNIGINGIFDTIGLVIGQIVIICGAIIVIAQRIPGDQPEKALQAFTDFVAKFSKK